MNDTQLHCHTQGSNLRMRDCIIKPKDLIDKAISLNMKAVAITDHASLSEHITAMKYSQELQKQGKDIKVLLGDEIYLVHDANKVRENYQSGQTKFYHFILIAKNRKGYDQLRAINAEGWKSSFMTGKMRRVPNDRKQLENIIGKEKGNLIATTACLGGELANCFLDNRMEDAKDFIKWCLTWFGKDNFAIEIQPSRKPEQVKFNQWAKKLADACGIKCIVTCDVHYLNKEHHDIHQAFLRSSDADRGETEDFYETTWMMNAEQKKEYFDYFSQDEFKQIVNNGWDLVKNCKSFSMEHTTIIPERDLSKIDYQIKHIFKPWYNKYEYIRKFAESEYEQDQYHLFMIEEGFLSKKQEFNDTNLSRIDWEFEQLWLISEALNSRMSAYYNLVDYIVDICWEIGFVGISRGSATGWYTAWLIDIQQMNPIQWNLPAYRHLNAQRVSFPDIDLDTSARNRPKIIQRLKEVFGEDNILNICTFKTETSKAALKTVCRGVGISLEEAEYISSLVPVERGRQWSLKECYNGDINNDKKPVMALVNESENLSKKYNIDFKEYAMMIEGLVSGLSSHASGIYLFKNGYLAQNSLMKTPRGDNVTCWSMEDSDWCGALKYDSLTTECQDKLEVCMELLLKYHKIQWQGSLRNTYNAYLHPSVLNFNDKEMWDECSRGQIIDLFQFITPVGGQCIKKIQPKNIVELTNANSLMRITVEGEQQPVDKFLAYKHNPSLWDEELANYGVTNSVEIQALDSVLGYCYHVPSMQEDVMELLQHPDISNFSLHDADVARKIIAKKKRDKVEELHDDFYKAVKENGHSINLANYVWNECIKPQLAYSFSRNHVMPYSAEAVQEMNLYHFYPHVYWNCAVLNVNSGLSGEEDSKGIQYGKVAGAIYRSAKFGVSMSPPSINSSENGFTPIEETNTIFYGISCIIGINSQIANQIISMRPYNSFLDFYRKNTFPGSLVTKSKIIQLIKAGCFDCFNTNRIKVMQEYFCLSTPQKTKLTTSNLPEMIKIGVEIPEELIKPYNFKKYVCQKQFFYSVHPLSKSKKLYKVDTTVMSYCEEYFISVMKEGADYWFVDSEVVICDKSIDKCFKPVFNELKSWLQRPETIKEYNKKAIIAAYNTLDCVDVDRWAMQSTSYYHNNGHELKNLDFKRYGISRFSDLPEEPVFVEKNFGQRSWRQYEISAIAGTLIAKDDTKHIITLLTTDYDVVNCKLTREAYAHYKRVISSGSGKDKVVYDDAWIQRGSLLIVCGYRNGDDFRCKKYKNSVYDHQMILIKHVYEDGSADLQTERTLIE